MQKETIYRPDIDGLRAIAVLSVMIYHLHAAWLPGGFVGVDIFFAISGFVVTASLAGSSAHSLPSFISEFYARRLARILPALVFVLIVSAFVATLFIPAAWLSSFSESTAKHAFFGLSNWVMQDNSDTYFAPRAEFNPYTHTWSLGVEEQFYLIAPLLVYFWLRAVRLAHVGSSRIAIAGVMLLALASFVGCVWASKAEPTAAFYSIVYRFWELASGALLFLITYRPLGTNRPHRRALLNHITSLLGLIGLAASLAVADGKNFPHPWAVLPVIGTLLMIAGARVEPADIVRRTLCAPAAIWVGKRSYSLYLWHWPVYVLMRWTVGLETASQFAVAVAVTFICAMFSYRYVEQPLRHNAWFERRANYLRIASFLLLPVLGFLIVFHFFHQRSRYSLSTVARESVDWYAGHRLPYENVGDRKCQVDTSYHQIAGGSELRFSPTQCRESLPARKMSVMGDSHAGHLAGAYEQASAEKGITVSVYSYPACNFIDFRMPMDVGRSPGCLEFSRTVTKEILAGSSVGDILLLSSLRLDRYGDQWASFNIKDMYAHMYNEESMKARRAAVEDAKQWLAPFADKRINVVFVAPTPVFKAPAFRCSDWFNRTNPICVGNNRQPRSELETLRKPIVDAMKGLSSTFPNVHLWDPFPLLCPAEICLTHRDGRPLFFDGDHFTAYSNLLLYPSFAKFISEM